MDAPVALVMLDSFQLAVLCAVLLKCKDLSKPKFLSLHS
jgi:hypothetical protein